jgi:AAA+ ATPase superfamily predicted ATPase
MFIGRKKELEDLGQLIVKSKKPNFVVIQGRRRIGKSTLVTECARKNKIYIFKAQGLAPRLGQTNQDQLNHMASVARLAKLKIETHYDDWYTLLYDICLLIQNKPRAILFLDEISWMGAHDPDFCGKIKNIWDLVIKNNKKINLILCGSVSAWIEDHVINSTDFVGRITRVMNLKELDIKSCLDFWQQYKYKTSFKQQLSFLTISGGVPLYLENLEPKESLESNINRLCFKNGGLLVREFESIFHDIFGRKSKTYKEIMMALLAGAKTITQIATLIKKEKNGVLGRYLKDLIISGFVQRENNFSIGGKPLKEVRFRISDNYVRFYLKYIYPNLARIEKGQYSFETLDKLHQWPIILGLQFENIVKNNIDIILSALNIKPNDILNVDSYIQKKNKLNKFGVQIDLMIETLRKELYIFEIKSSAFVKVDVVSEINSKVKKLKYPKYYTIRTGLIYAGQLQDPEYISEKIDYVIDYELLCKTPLS